VIARPEGHLISLPEESACREAAVEASRIGADLLEAVCEPDGRVTRRNVFGLIRGRPVVAAGVV
jgi:hypothetical protein